jgi:DNA polymerase elongation subunit (family B)
MGYSFYTNVQMIGNQFLVRGYDGSKNFLIREDFSPSLFVPSKVPTKYKTLEGEYVQEIKPGTVRDCREFRKKYEYTPNFKIYGNEKYIYQYISEKYPEQDLNFDISKILLYTIDIEVASENGFPDVLSAAEDILLITIQDYNTKKIKTWGVGPYKHSRKDLEYHEFATEREMLTAFIGWWSVNTPEVITGWNSEFYDIPYLVRRIDRVLGEKRMKRLSPWGLVSERERMFKGKMQLGYDIGGISQLDYLKLYQWSPATDSQSSYRLDHIASVELNEKKLDHSEFDTFKDFYTKGWEKFVSYNIVDVELVNKLEEKFKLIELAITMAYGAKVNYEDIFSQVRLWDMIIYNHLKQKNIVIPPKVLSDKGEQFEGAYVKEPVPGMYNYVVNFDLNSLYPHLIMMYNLGPETLVDKKHPSVSVDKILNKTADFTGYENYTICANGAMYRKDKQSFLSELMEKMYNDRVIYKKKMISAKKEYEQTKNPALIKEIARCDNIQMAKKISLNSAYGSLGNQYFRYYKLVNAEAVTFSGKVSIRWIENKLNSFLNNLLQTESVDYVIASDTDSIYLNMEGLVNKVYGDREKNNKSIVNFLDKVCKEKLEPFIETSFQELADYVNAYSQKMQMKRENIADRGIWTAKKRYILNVWDSEGVRYSEAKPKIVGIEAIQSSTPVPCREMIGDVIKIIMNESEDDLIKYIADKKKAFYSLASKDIAIAKSVNDVRKYTSSDTIFGKKCPIAVRGATLYNHHVKQLNLVHKYSLIGNGEKIKYIYLKLPNPIHQNVISFFQEIPPEFGLDKYIDYDVQFNKSFLDPVTKILNVIGWKTYKPVTLDSFFI